MQKQYLFYDLETSGTNLAFDQIYQFGAILTNESFKELERQEIFIKQRPDVVCSPGAMKTAPCLEKETCRGGAQHHN